MKNTATCKICGASAPERFRIPVSKQTGHPIPDLPDDCSYYECSQCGFCFSTHLDAADHSEVYDDEYWNKQDPDWYGRVSETLRLVLLSNQLVQKPPDRLEILDFGCGMGTFVETCRRNLQLAAWGTDIIRPKFGLDYFLSQIGRKFDIIVACEVVEHIPTPLETFRAMRDMLKPGGALAFQTAGPRTSAAAIGGTSDRTMGISVSIPEGLSTISSSSWAARRGYLGGIIQGFRHGSSVLTPAWRNRSRIGWRRSTTATPGS